MVCCSVRVQPPKGSDRSFQSKRLCLVKIDKRGSGSAVGKRFDPELARPLNGCIMHYDRHIGRAHRCVSVYTKSFLLPTRTTPLFCFIIIQQSVCSSHLPPPLTTFNLSSLCAACTSGSLWSCINFLSSSSAIISWLSRDGSIEVNNGAALTTTIQKK